MIKEIIVMIIPIIVAIVTMTIIVGILVMKTR